MIHFSVFERDLASGQKPFSINRNHWAIFYARKSISRRRRRRPVVDVIKLFLKKQAKAGFF